MSIIKFKVVNNYSDDTFQHQIISDYDTFDEAKQCFLSKYNSYHESSTFEDNYKKRIISDKEENKKEYDEYKLYSEEYENDEMKEENDEFHYDICDYKIPYMLQYYRFKYGKLNNCTYIETLSDCKIKEYNNIEISEFIFEIENKYIGNSDDNHYRYHGFKIIVCIK